jgi:hypothetical protein
MRRCIVGGAAHLTSSRDETQRDTKPIAAPLRLATIAAAFGVSLNLAALRAQMPGLA